MAYVPSRIVTVKTEVSPSSLWNNLAVTSSTVAYAHKDAAYLCDVKSMDGRVPVRLTKMTLCDPPQGVTSIAAVVLSGKSYYAVTTRSAVQVCSCTTGELIASHKLSAADVSVRGEVSHQYFQASVAVPVRDCLAVGTSWGDILCMNLTLGEADLKVAEVLPAGRVSITALACSDRWLVSGDDDGCLNIWDGVSFKLKKQYAANGCPITSLHILDSLILASDAAGYIRVYTTGDAPDDHYLAVEIAAHARCITALHVHPFQKTFASVGEDAMLNVWSLPEYLVSGKFKVICDMHAPIPDAVVTGVAFTSAGHKAPSNVIVSVYDSTSLRVFLGL